MDEQGLTTRIEVGENMKFDDMNTGFIAQEKDNCIPTLSSLNTNGVPVIDVEIISSEKICSNSMSAIDEVHLNARLNIIPENIQKDVPISDMQNMPASDKLPLSNLQDIQSIEPLPISNQKTVSSKFHVSKPIIKSKESGRACESSPKTSQSLNKASFMDILEHKCCELGFPYTSTLKAKGILLYEVHLSKLEYLNDLMMKLYSAVLLYLSSSNKSKKSFFQKGFKPQMFVNACKELEKLNLQVDSGRKTDELTCNLYKISC